MMRMLFGALFVLGLARPALAQPTPSVPAFDPYDVETYARKALADWNVPGVAVAIVKDGKVLMTRGIGVREVGKSEPVNEHTLFGIASCSKAFAAASLAILVDEGKLRWDDKVTKYLPGFQLYDPFVSRELTVKDLLCHRSGLATFGGDLLWYNTNYNRDEVLRRIRFLKPISSFRSQFGYQNILFLGAGEIVPKVTGKSWDEFVHERIFAPLGMNDAVTKIGSITSSTNAATPHTLRGSQAVALPRYNTDNIAPAAGIQASADDMSRWLCLQLGMGQYEGKRIYSPTQARTMWSPQFALGLVGDPSRESPAHIRTYAMGWFVSDYHGRLRVEHDGSIDGMFSKVILLPELKIGVAAMANSDTAVAEAVANRAIDGLLGVALRDRSGEALARHRLQEQAKKAAWDRTVAARAKDTKPSLPLGQYSAKYGGDLYGDVAVTLEDGKLVMRFLPAPVFVADLEHWHHDTFRVKWRTLNPYIPDGWATFAIDRRGRVTEVHVDCPNNDFDFKELELKRRG